MTALGLKSTTATLRANLETVLDEANDATADAVFSTEEREMIRNILRLRETRVEDVMVPRAEIDAVPETITLNDLILRFRECGHSRMPVYRETLDDAEGMVHIRDLMTYVSAVAATPAAGAAATTEGEPAMLDLTRVDLSLPLIETGIVREVLVVPASVPIADLIKQMQTKRLQMALVIDEYGGVDGLASLEDLVEVVVGDIEDEHDIDDDPEIAVIGVGEWQIDGQAAIEDVTELTGADLTACEVSEEVDTVGGLVVALAGRVPAEGEKISTAELDGYEFEVIEADQLRVKRLKLFKLMPKDELEAKQSAA
ncbi:MAG: HlyC/CorC family transporter [Hyphomicrobiaceae bacterium]|nr:HlyC/CorC family transporter [Hyphomicrobiaceae bacterium]